jgi:lipoic acid synthetase
MPPRIPSRTPSPFRIIATPPVERPRLPEWFRVRQRLGSEYEAVKKTLAGHRLNTVCQEANCPNIRECWHHRTATFMILGDICTRGCTFCDVRKGRPVTLDREEPERVALAAAELGLRYVVVTSVDRDDLPDGGADVFADTIRALRTHIPGVEVEVLIPDFQGQADALRTVLDARPDVLNHNLETIPRLYPTVRRGARYAQSLDLLRRARALAPDIATKSGLMVGLGESIRELLETMRDIRATGCDLLTVGQYLAPSADHHPVIQFYPPRTFARLARYGNALGFRNVFAGPLVRSSYHAFEQR